MKPEKKFYREKTFIFLCIAAGIAAGIILKFFVIDILRISGTSMEPALKNGSRVAVNKLAYGLLKPFRGEFFFQWNEPETDDIVIYLHDNKIVIKRVVGESGDLLEFSENSRYTVKINQKEISLTPVQFQRMKNFEKIPEGYVFTLGDNQKNSVDSRDYGFVSVKNIMGKIIGK